MNVRVRWAIALGIVCSGLGCREIIGVPGENDLRAIEGQPPLCECSPLDQQGAEFVDACVAAYASLPDFGTDADEDTFASKEDMLASPCAVCQQGDEAFVVACYGKLLASAGAGEGLPGAPCDLPQECGGMACCGGQVGSPDLLTTPGTCCPLEGDEAVSVGCASCLTALLPGEAIPDGTYACAGTIAVATPLIDCLCAMLPPATPTIECRQECYSLAGEPRCDASPACWECAVQTNWVAEDCGALLDECLDDTPQPFRP